MNQFELSEDDPLNVDVTKFYFIPNYTWEGGEDGVELSYSIEGSVNGRVLSFGYGIQTIRFKSNEQDSTDSICGSVSFALDHTESNNSGLYTFNNRGDGLTTVVNRLGTFEVGFVRNGI